MIRKVTWDPGTDAGTWVILNRATGEVIGAVQVEPRGDEPIRHYSIFSDQIGVPPEIGTVDASIIDEARALALWITHQN
jgi:hypothetical protein